MNRNYQERGREIYRKKKNNQNKTQNDFAKHYKVQNFCNLRIYGQY
jgi:hypothetical protein